MENIINFIELDNSNNEAAPAIKGTFWSPLAQFLYSNAGLSTAPALGDKVSKQGNLCASYYNDGIEVITSNVKLKAGKCLKFPSFTATRLLFYLLDEVAFTDTRDEVNRCILFKDQQQQLEAYFNLSVIAKALNVSKKTLYRAINELMEFADSGVKFRAYGNETKLTKVYKTDKKGEKFAKNEATKEAYSDIIDFSDLQIQYFEKDFNDRPLNKWRISFPKDLVRYIQKKGKRLNIANVTSPTAYILAYSMARMDAAHQMGVYNWGKCTKYDRNKLFDFAGLSRRGKLAGAKHYKRTLKRCNEAFETLANSGVISGELTYINKFAETYKLTGETEQITCFNKDIFETKGIIQATLNFDVHTERFKEMQIKRKLRAEKRRKERKKLVEKKLKEYFNVDYSNVSFDCFEKILKDKKPKAKKHLNHNLKQLSQCRKELFDAKGLKKDTLKKQYMGLSVLQKFNL